MHIFQLILAELYNYIKSLFRLKEKKWVQNAIIMKS